MTPLHFMTAEGGNTILFPFLNLNGALVPSRPTFEREIRTGINGVGIWATGNRGEPFGVNTLLDCESVAAAGLAFKAYHASIMSKKNLYYCGALFGTVLIHNVLLTEIRKLTRRVGGINGSGAGGAMLYAQWTLEALYPG